jgi:hypothetical protein
MIKVGHSDVLFPSTLLLNFFPVLVAYVLPIPCPLRDIYLSNDFRGNDFPQDEGEVYPMYVLKRFGMKQNLYLDTRQPGL